MTTPARFASRPPAGAGGSLRSGRALAAWAPPRGQYIAEAPMPQWLASSEPPVDRL
jgi:hypothetical protein